MLTLFLIIQMPSSKNIYQRSFTQILMSTYLTTDDPPTANRISTLHDFGFVALDMKYTQEEDSGTYTCRATNDLGQAVTSATAVIQCKEEEGQRLTVPSRCGDVNWGNTLWCMFVSHGLNIAAGRF